MKGYVLPLQPKHAARQTFLPPRLMNSHADGIEFPLIKGANQLLRRLRRIRPAETRSANHCN